jgi:hypothetical protein
MLLSIPSSYIIFPGLSEHKHYFSLDCHIFVSYRYSKSPLWWLGSRTITTENMWCAPHECIWMYDGFQYLLEECLWEHLLRRVKLKC